LSQIILNGLIAGCLYALIGISGSVIYHPTRFLHFAHGGILTCGPYTVFFLLHQLSFPFTAALLGAVIIPAILGGLLDIVIYRPLRRRGGHTLVMLLASLGLYILLQNALSLGFGDDTKTLKSGDVVEGIVMLGARVTPVQVWSLVITVLVFITIWIVMRTTYFGKALRAVSSDRELARIRGINTDAVILQAFILGSGLAGLAGLLIALDVDMTPTMGLNALMMGVVVMIIGGTNSLTGIVIGGIFLGIIQQFAGWKLGSQWNEVFAFLLLILFILIKPSGIIGIRSQKSTI